MGTGLHTVGNILEVDVIRQRLGHHGRTRGGNRSSHCGEHPVPEDVAVIRQGLGHQGDSR